MRAPKGLEAEELHAGRHQVHQLDGLLHHARRDAGHVSDPRNAHDLFVQGAAMEHAPVLAELLPVVRMDHHHRPLPAILRAQAIEEPPEEAVRIGDLGIV